MPDEIVFQTKTQIALTQLRAARAAGIEAEVALLDAGYGTDTNLRDGITETGLPYVVSIQSSTSLWPPGVEPLPPKPWSGARPSDARDPAQHRAPADPIRRHPDAAHRGQPPISLQRIWLSMGELRPLAGADLGVAEG